MFYSVLWDVLLVSKDVDSGCASGREFPDMQEAHMFKLEIWASLDHMKHFSQSFAKVSKPRNAKTVAIMA